MDGTVQSYDAESSERLAAKSLCASELFENGLSLAKDLQILHYKLSRYIRQFHALLTWRRGSAALKMVGSAAKTVASLMVLAAPLHPKLQIALGVGHRLWKLGAGLKILNIFANIVKDLWQNGCRRCLIDFGHAATLLSRNIGVFGEVVEDLQKTAIQMNFGRTAEAPMQFFSIVKEFIPTAQHVYAEHVSRIMFGAERYSPLFDFISLMTDPSNQTLPMQLVRELESFNFTEFVEHKTDSKAVMAVSSLIHVSWELLDFLDGFQQFTDRDCNFLRDCLMKLTEESGSIMNVASFLDSLNKEKMNKDDPKKKTSSRKAIGYTPETSKPKPIETEIVTGSAHNSMDVDPPMQETPIIPKSCQNALNSSPSSKIHQSSPKDNTNGLITKEAAEICEDDTKTTIYMRTFTSLSDLVKKGHSVLPSIPGMKSKSSSPTHTSLEVEPLVPEMSVSFNCNQNALNSSPLADNTDIHQSSSSKTPIYMRPFTSLSDLVKKGHSVLPSIPGMKSKSSTHCSMEVDPPLQESSINSDAVQNALISSFPDDSHQSSPKDKNNSLKINEPAERVDQDDSRATIYIRTFTSLTDLVKKSHSVLPSIPGIKSKPSSPIRSSMEVEPLVVQEISNFDSNQSALNSSPTADIHQSSSKNVVSECSKSKETAEISGDGLKTSVYIQHFTSLSALVKKGYSVLPSIPGVKFKSTSYAPSSKEIESPLQEMSIDFDAQQNALTPDDTHQSSTKDNDNCFKSGERIEINPDASKTTLYARTFTSLTNLVKKSHSVIPSFKGMNSKTTVHISEEHKDQNSKCQFQEGDSVNRI